MHQSVCPSASLYLENNLRCCGHPQIIGELLDIALGCYTHFGLVCFLNKNNNIFLKHQKIKDTYFNILYLGNMTIIFHLTHNLFYLKLNYWMT